MKKNKQKKTRKLPQLKKDIKDFLTNEEGKISKKNVAKIGVSLAVLAMALDHKSAQAQHSNHSNHNNGMNDTASGGWHNSGGVHTNSHANHGNHSSGGWC